jgi:hypothetical protein
VQISTMFHIFILTEGEHVSNTWIHRYSYMCEVNCAKGHFGHMLTPGSQCEKRQHLQVCSMQSKQAVSPNSCMQGRSMCVVLRFCCWCCAELRHSIYAKWICLEVPQITKTAAAYK